MDALKAALKEATQRYRFAPSIEGGPVSEPGKERYLFARLPQGAVVVLSYRDGEGYKVGLAESPGLPLLLPESWQDEDSACRYFASLFYRLAGEAEFARALRAPVLPVRFAEEPGKKKG